MYVILIFFWTSCQKHFTLYLSIEYFIVQLQCWPGTWAKKSILPPAISSSSCSLTWCAGMLRWPPGVLMISLRPGCMGEKANKNQYLITLWVPLLLCNKCFRPSVKRGEDTLYSVEMKKPHRQREPFPWSYRVFFLNGPTQKVLSIGLHSRSHQKRSEFTDWHLELFG